MSEQNRLQINWTNSAGAALGAVSSAVVLSSLGAVGTLVGAALGSLCITIGGAVYAHYLALTKERVAAQARAARGVSRTRERVPMGAGASAVQERYSTEDRAEVERPQYAERPQPERSAGRGRAGLPWKRILAASAALFGIAMAVIVTFELTTGRAVSTYTGGTSNTGVGTSIPGWSGTGQESPEVELDLPDEVPLPDDVLPEDIPLPEDVPLPGDEAQVDEAPAEAPADEAPAEAPAEEAPAEEPGQ
ncbi:MAG: hypothetical protein ACR2FV_08285 [Ornithinimicrobium sp.]|uniref:hypothetical protein n=1 Tax=Ornithinimicrobium sp. TaxID=1977084 RepID=UPI003D9AC922